MVFGDQKYAHMLMASWPDLRKWTMRGMFRLHPVMVVPKGVGEEVGRGVMKAGEMMGTVGDVLQVLCRLFRLTAVAG